MNKKRNLLGELGMREHDRAAPCALDISIDKIKDTVKAQIDSVPEERKYKTMKSKKKIFTIAIAAALTLGITAFAAGGIVKNWYSTSSSEAEYKSLPTQQQCINDIGYVPVLINEFDNGYTFMSGSIVNNKLADENDNLMESFKSVCFRYEKDNDTVIFSQDKFNSDAEDFGELLTTIDGAEIYGFNYTNKLVPADYKMTEEDKKAEKNGELTFSYGSSEVEINEVVGVYWQRNGIRYELMQINGSLSQTDFVEMAEQIIAE